MTAEGLQKHSFFSRVDGSEARQDKKLPEGIAFPTVPRTVPGSPCKVVHCPDSDGDGVEILFGSPEAAGRCDS